MSDTACALTTLSRPCASCPWRLDQDAGDIPNFDMDKAEGLSRCCPNERGFGPEFGAPMFSCHQSKDGAEFPCAGWLATVGARHPGVRFAAMAGRIPVAALEPGADWPELHDNYPEVLEKLRETAS